MHDLLDEKGAARMIGGEASPVSTRALQRWRLEGTGPVYLQVGRLVRYRRADIESWLNSRRRVSTSSSVGA